MGPQVPEESDIRDRLRAAADAGRQPQVREPLLQRRQHPDVVDDDLVNPEVQKAGDAFEELSALPRLGDGVDRDLEPSSGRGGLSLRGHQLVPVKLSARPTPAPTLQAHVHGVCPRVERGSNGLTTSGGRQQDGHGRHSTTR
jgi:hypothetical protein